MTLVYLLLGLAIFGLLFWMTVRGRSRPEDRTLELIPMYAILFVVFIVGGTALLSWPLGRYMKWAMDPAEPAGSPSGWTRTFRSIGGVLVAAVAGLEGLHGRHARLQCRDVRRELRHPGAAAIPAAQSRRQRRDQRGPDLQHRRLVHVQHQPAALFRRSLDELLFAARRADVAAVRVGSDRYCRIGGSRTRAGRPSSRQLLRRPAASHVPRPAPGRACRRDPLPTRRDADDLPGFGRGHHPRRHSADDRARTGRCVRGDQADRHQRRGLLRTEQHASLREPELLDQRDWR